MADQPTAPADMVDAPPADAPPDDTAPNDPAAELAKWKALSRKHEKAAQSFETRLREIEDRDKTEAQRLAERAEAAERAAAEREAELRRYRVGTAKGLPADLIERLRGDSDDDLAADADKLLGLLPAPVQPRATGAPDQGARTDLSNAALNGDPLLESVKSKLGIR